MSWQTYFVIIFAVLAIAAALFSLVPRVGPDASSVAQERARSARTGARVIAAGLAFFALLFVILGSFTIVGTRQVGIMTSFGKPTGATLNNGLHFKPFWQNTNEMDAAIQIDKYDGDRRIKVRLGNSSTALADASIRWNIKADAADELFVQYKTFDNVRVNLVERNLAVALNEVFASFDPLAPQNLDRSPLPALSAEALAKLQTKVGAQVEVLDVSVPVIDFDDNTEGKINQLNAERANTSVALQAQKTAEAQKKANEILSSSVSNDPNVIVANCVSKALDKAISPLGCWPANGVVPTIPAR
jgi:regulator of protease activity HflC (stomatin/prohibitin superfamily)